MSVNQLKMLESVQRTSEILEEDSERCLSAAMVNDHYSVIR